MELNYSRAGAGEPLLLLHGIGSHWQMWEPVMPMLTARHDVIASTCRGSGTRRCRRRERRRELTRCASCCSVSCNSWASIARMWPATRSAGWWRWSSPGGAGAHVCALSPAGFFSPAEIALARRHLSFTVRLTRLLAPHADASPRGRGQRKLLMNVFMAHPDGFRVSEAAASLRAMAGAPWFDDTLPAISPWEPDPALDPSVPVTIGWGEKDRLLLPRQGQRAVAMIPSARLVPLIDCGHLPTFDDPAAGRGPDAGDDRRRRSD